MNQRHHHLYVKHLEKGRFVMPKRGLPKTPDIDGMMEKDMAKEKKTFFVTVRGSRWVHIENYAYIADYKEDKIKIMGKQQMMIIEGRCLSIIYFTEDDVLIKGCIYAVRYV